MANRIVKIEDICHVVKGETGIMKAIPGEYPMVVLSEERKTHNEYQFDCKAVIIPLVSSTGHGHASMKRIHYQEGKFALGSILCALVPKKEGEYDPEYLYHILDMGKERIFVPLMKGMANVSLPMNRIKSVEINLPSYDEQVRLSKIYTEVTTNLDLLKNQTDKQHKYLKQLRQSILQMAVQGKLTAKWREENPNVESVSVLLDRIKAEKEKLIKEGSLKREKPLSKISENEKPFVLPKNWAWIRLGEITQIKGGKRVPNTDKLSEIKTEHIYIRIRDMKNGTIVKNNLVYITNETFQKIKNYTISKNDLYITIAGTIGQVGDVPEFFHNMNLTENAAKIILFITEKEYLKLILSSDLCQYQFMQSTKGMAQPKLALKRIENAIIPMPCLVEQKEIVTIANKLLNFCDELEKKIEKRDSYQERIMQAVVKQAFTTKIETVETE